ncbi:hypothetical protein HPB50_022156 [Hyalomma asiaticum]|uniref:Uncharacterized protein n=1 Tax=Hyalomma asiaticum TaxID=266040 RepID=A0ACB7RYA1_HYAAI|nr:hypothetical protein HPB50_022156 [Hyalomma asiaticum]
MARFAVGICAMLALLAPLKIAGSQRETVDAFRAMNFFKTGVSIYTSINDPAFKCLTTNQTSFDLEAKKATYIWHFRGYGGTDKQTVTFHVREGKTPDEVTYVLNNDCMLWVKPDVVHSVPRHCVDNYKQKCPTRYPTYDSDHCNADE